MVGNMNVALATLHPDWGSKRSSCLWSPGVRRPVNPKGWHKAKPVGWRR